jgi:acyl-[acyl-carrier-protein] desaturase
LTLQGCRGWNCRPASVYSAVAISVELASRAQRSICVERGLTGLYRWYIGRSQGQRAWNPDRDFAWRTLRQDQPEAVHAVIEGFYAVEQFVPDYVRTLLRVIRESYGRSHFHLRWGAEEEKHADLWRNALLSLGRRSVSWVEEHTRILRARTYELPWDDPLHMLFYAVLQERATHVVYKALESAVAGGQSRGLIAVPDPVMARAAGTIALDEAAHYLSSSRPHAFTSITFPRRRCGRSSMCSGTFRCPRTTSFPATTSSGACFTSPDCSAGARTTRTSSRSR